MPARSETLRIAGERVATERTAEVFNPFTRAAIGTVALASVADVRRAVAAGKTFRSKLTRNASAVR